MVASIFWRSFSFEHAASWISQVVVGKEWRTYQCVLYFCSWYLWMSHKDITCCKSPLFQGNIFGRYDSMPLCRNSMPGNCPCLANDELWWPPHKVPNSDSICYWDGNIGNPPMKQLLIIFRLLCNLQAGWSIEIWRQQSALKYLRPHHTEIAILMKYDSTTGRCFVLNRAAPKPVASHDFPIKISDIFKCLFHVSL